MRTITPEESRKLFDYCRSKGVKYYDVQVELVDHLASAIEEQWKTNPELDFETALYSTCQKFGNQGFKNLIQEKRKNIRKKYNWMLRNYLIEFYSWPKITLTTVLTFLYYLFLTHTNNLFLTVLYPSLTILFVFSGYEIYFKFFLAGKISKKKNILMFEELINLHKNSIAFSFFSISNIPFVRFTNESRILSQWFLIGFSLLYVTAFLVLYAEYIYIGEKAKTEIKKLIDLSSC